MGYRKQKTIYKLVFTDEEYEGLIVRAYSPPLDEFFKLADMDIEQLQQSQTLTKADQEQMLALFQFFTRYLVTWNVEHQDHRIVDPATKAVACDAVEGCACPWVATPPTVDGLRTQDLDFVIHIITTWMETLASVPMGKEKPSNDGSPPALEQSIPMMAVS